MAKLLSVAALAMMATAVVAQPTLIPDPTANQVPASTDPSLLTTPDAALTTTTDLSAPLPGPGPNPDAATTMVGASGGAGAWSFDYDYLGCSDNSWTGCSSPVGDKYSPEDNGYFVSTGGPVVVRLWYPMVNTNYDLYIEKWSGSQWQNFMTGDAQTSWQKRANFNTVSGERYRFRSYHRSGSGYYTMSWKYGN